MMIVVDDYYQTETKYYYHRDALGNVMALSNAAGNIVEGYTYSAFGIAKVNYSAGPDGDWLTPDGATGSASFKGNPYMFTGRNYDWETGLYYYRARYYDATLGRFISADPISYAGGMNLYAYVMNNPINYIDPFGTQCIMIVPHSVLENAVQECPQGEEGDCNEWEECFDDCMDKMLLGAERRRLTAALGAVGFVKLLRDFSGIEAGPFATAVNGTAAVVGTHVTMSAVGCAIGCALPASPNFFLFEKQDDPLDPYYTWGP